MTMSLATSQSHSVREFLDLAASFAGVRVGRVASKVILAIFVRLKLTFFREMPARPGKLSDRGPKLVRRTSACYGRLGLRISPPGAYFA